MPHQTTNLSDRKRVRQAALARWADEGGAGAPLSQQDTDQDAAPDTPPVLTDAELVQLQIRVIALENLVIALLANASDAAQEQARELAACISPRPGFTRHRLTLHAASQMGHLIGRACLVSERTGKAVGDGSGLADSGLQARDPPVVWRTDAEPQTHQS